MSKVVAAAGVMVLLLAGASPAATLRVPSEYSRIIGAVDAAVPGDTVLVAPGTYSYHETRSLPDGLSSTSVVFLKSGVAVISELGPESTIVELNDATTSSPVAFRGAHLFGTTEIRGFTVRGSNPDLDGVAVTHSETLVVRDCVFRDFGDGTKNAYGVGGTSSDIEVYDCVFQDIHGTGRSGAGGTSCRVVIEDCEFTRCRSFPVGAQYIDSRPHPASLTVRRCRFIDNESVGGPGVINAKGLESVTIEYCWFEGNQGPSGGAVSTSGTTSVQRIEGCTFVGNRATPHGTGGALRLSGGDVEIRGNTFWGNSQEFSWSGNGGSTIYMDGGTFTLWNNIVAGSSGDWAVRKVDGLAIGHCTVYFANENGNSLGVQEQTGVIVADPQFCNLLQNNFQLQPTSPCLPENSSSCSEIIGAHGAGCGTVSIERTSWGNLKASFRTEEDRP
jgi:hypothetical protein